MARKMFISFTGLLREMSSGRVSDQDLAEGLFYFGCIREYALEPWRGDKGGIRNVLNWFFEEDRDKGAVVHRKIVAALEQAEKDGRSRFRELHEHNSFAEAFDLLRANGYPATESEIKEALEAINETSHHYNLYVMQRLVEHLFGDDLAVVH